MLNRFGTMLYLLATLLLVASPVAVLVAPGTAQAATYEQVVASSVVMAGGTMTDGVPKVIYTSANITGGAANSACRLYIEYEVMDPDTETVSPFDFEVRVELQQYQNSQWRMIGQQNTPLRKLSQGDLRFIMVGQQLDLSDEGADIVWTGFAGTPTLVKSTFQDDCSGTLRVLVYAIDNDTGGSNPFVDVTMTIEIRRT